MECGIVCAGVLPLGGDGGLLGVGKVGKDPCKGTIFHLVTWCRVPRWIHTEICCCHVINGGAVCQGGA